MIIILTRAGLGLDLSGLKRLGRPALLMCYIPASFEIAGMLLLAPKLMGIIVLEAAVMGAVLAAVSPAVVVPRMVKLMEEGYGTKQGIPQLILAGASVDDVYVIVLFSTFIGMMQGECASIISFINIPVSIILGSIIGIVVGVILDTFFKKIHIRDTAKVLIILSISMLLVVAEDVLTTSITFSALIAIMFIGIGLQQKRPQFRMIGVYVCFLGTGIDKKARLFTMMAYTPKATVQAAIGGIPLALALDCGEIVLTVAVLTIVITAPLGAFAMDLSYRRLLELD